MKLRYLFIAVMLALCLSGCSQETVEIGYTEPTLPSLNETQTPNQLLQAAIDKLAGQDVSLSYGMGWQEELTLSPADREDLPVSNEDFIGQFCQLPLTVSPSKDGTFCFQVTELTPEQLSQLLRGEALTHQQQQQLSAYPDAEGTVKIGVDAKGAFQYLQVDVLLSERIWTLQISVNS